MINIQKNDGGQYVHNHFLGTYDFYLRSLRCRPPFDSIGGTFDIKFSHVNQAALNTLVDNIKPGNEATIWIGKTDSTKQKVFLGTIEELIVEEWSRKWMDVIIRGPDWGSDVLASRYLSMQVEQDKEADGETPDSNDPDSKYEAIVQSMLTDPDKYMVQDFALDDVGLVVNPANIVTTDRNATMFEARGETPYDKLREIDQEIGTIHYVDPDKNFFWQYPQITDSKIIVSDDPTDSVLTGWAKDKIGFISSRRPFVTTNSLMHHGRRLLGLGADQQSKDQFQETTSSSDPLDTLHRGTRFQPVHRVCPKIGVFLSKDGTGADIPFSLREDFNDSPTGDVLHDVTLPKAILTAGKWHYVLIGQTLNTAKKYWIVLGKNGDGTNRARWHKGSTGWDTSTSSDDVTWGAPSNGAGYAFRQYHQTPVISSIQTPILTAASKHFHEKLFRKPTVTEKNKMYNLLNSESTNIFKQKQMLKYLCYFPDTILKQGQKLRLRKQKSGRTYDNTFVVASPEYIFEAGKRTLYQELTVSRFVDYA